MNEEVQKKAMEMLEELAAKLGTTGDHLWEILVAQGRIEAVNTLVVLVLAIGLTFVTHRYVWAWMWRKPESEGRCWVTGLLSVVSTLFTLKAAFGIGSLATKLFNPEYWALQRILKLF